MYLCALYFLLQALVYNLCLVINEYLWRIRDYFKKYRFQLWVIKVILWPFIWQHWSSSSYPNKDIIFLQMFFLNMNSRLSPIYYIFYRTGSKEFEASQHKAIANVYGNRNANYHDLCTRIQFSHCSQKICTVSMYESK